MSAQAGPASVQNRDGGCTSGGERPQDFFADTVATAGGDDAFSFNGEFGSPGVDGAVSVVVPDLARVSIGEWPWWLHLYGLLQQM